MTYSLFQQFLANHASDVAAVNAFPGPVFAKHIRLVPTEWNNQIAMRFALLGCAPAPETTTTAGKVFFFQLGTWQFFLTYLLGLRIVGAVGSGNYTSS